MKCTVGEMIVDEINASPIFYIKKLHTLADYKQRNYCAPIIDKGQIKKLLCPIILESYENSTAATDSDTTNTPTLGELYLSPS